MKQLSKHAGGATRAARTRSEQGNAPLPLLSAVKALAIDLGISLLLLLSAALAAYFTPDPDRLILPLGLAVSVLSAFLGGYLTLILHRRSALLCGLCFAALMTLLSLPLTLLLSAYGVAYPLLLTCTMRTSLFLLSVAGAFCALRRMERLPKKKRHRHA